MWDLFQPEEACRYRIDFMWLPEVEKQLQAVQERVEKATGLHKLKDLQEYLKASKENISFVAGQDHRKSEEQRKWEMLDRLCAADAKLCGKRFFGKLFARLEFSGQNCLAQHLIGFIRKDSLFLSACKAILLLLCLIPCIRIHLESSSIIYAKIEMHRSLTL